MFADKYRFRHPAKVVIAGPSGCGKTCFVQRIIDHVDQLFTVIPRKIIYTYRYVQPWFQAYQYRVHFTTSIPSKLGPEPSLVILDDLAMEPAALREAMFLFTRRAHHENASVLFITQNFFNASPDHRTIGLNASAIVLFKTVRGVYQIEILGRQIFGSKHTRDFLDAYKCATESPYSYLLIDLHPDESHRLRANILPTDRFEQVFLLS